MDIFERCYNFTDAKEAMKTGLYPYFHALQTGAGHRGRHRRQAHHHDRLQQLHGADIRPEDDPGRQGRARQIRHWLLGFPVPQRHAGAARTAGNGACRLLPQGSGADLEHGLSDEPRHHLLDRGLARLYHKRQREPRQHRGRLQAELLQEIPEVQAQRHGGP